MKTPNTLLLFSVAFTVTIALAVLYTSLHLPPPPVPTPTTPTTPFPPLRHLPHAEPNICWIVNCADRDLKHAQHFHAPGFRHIRLGMPPYVKALSLHPVWCRVGHLRDIRATGQRCVIYADDDVYLNLTRLRAEIARNEPGDILVLAAPRHGEAMHINAGFVVFTDIQSAIARYVVDVWYASRVQPDTLPLWYLRDQAALNRIVKCSYPGIVCYLKTYDARDEAPKLGMLYHCISVHDRDRPGTKAECMKRLKLGRSAPWDAEGVKRIRAASGKD